MKDVAMSQTGKNPPSLEKGEESPKSQREPSPERRLAARCLKGRTADAAPQQGRN